MFKTFEDFLLESKKEIFDLHKIYLAISTDSGHRWFNYKKFAGEKFFIQITNENYKEIKINKNYPILNYNSSVIKLLLEENLIKEENIYNLPEEIKKSGNKKLFHEILKENKYLPKTVFSSKDIDKLKFPIIAKPAEGHSGIGIKIFKTLKEFKAYENNSFEIFSEFIEKKEEHRIITFKDSILCWMERKPMNKKAINGDGNAQSSMDFKYIKKNKNELPSSFLKVITEISNKFENLSYITFDLMLDNSNKIYLIEINTQPGVPYDSTVELYKKIFEDFFKRKIEIKTNKMLFKYSNYLDKKTCEIDPKRFEIH